MSIFGTLMSKILGRSHDVSAPAASPAASPAAGIVAGSSSTAPAPAAAAAPATPPPEVDVEAVLEGLASKYSHKVNWRYSIVDLMTLVGMDSSLSARRELAHELGYTGDTNDTATMNIWLHKQVIRKLAENGGKVPADLLD
jgi:3-oxoacyl-ACP reductase-like protein